VAIVGDGFFQVNDGTRFLYTRAGNFAVNANGEVVVASADRGRQLEPAINIPQDALEISISADGIVSVLQPNSNQPTEVGQIQLARFINPQGLMQLGENLYADTLASGNPQISTPGQDGLGTLRQRFLEASNTEPVRELVDLITTQRTFELNSQVIQVADQSLQLVANLRRF
jgi:flagellar basal-body rod protein FlgG